MATKITPHLIELTYEAALKSFWRKKALRKFLIASHISENFLATWAGDESKRDFLDRIFDNLQKTDKGKSVIFQMATNLSEQTAFPDLRNWEDSDQKNSAAAKAVKELKYYLGKQNEKIRNEKEKEQSRKHAQKLKEKIRKSQTDLEKLQKRLDVLSLQVGTQNSGYAFQEWFYDFLDFFEITNRRPYNSGGRQIDGSVTHDGTTYLVELKFTTAQTVATDIDSLRAKVKSKADNTMGILLSISGFSSVAIKEASGRGSVVLLMDAQHIYMCLSGQLRFEDIISRIRRHASQTGEAYLKGSKFGG